METPNLVLLFFFRVEFLWIQAAEKKRRFAVVRSDLGRYGAIEN